MLEAPGSLVEGHGQGAAVGHIERGDRRRFDYAECSLLDADREPRRIG